MGIIEISKCDLCQTEQRPEQNRHWTDSYGKAIIDFKDCCNVQSKDELFLCSKCQRSLNEKICEAIKLLKKDPTAEEQA